VTAGVVTAGVVTAGVVTAGVVTAGVVFAGVVVVTTVVVVHIPELVDPGAAGGVVAHGYPWSTAEAKAYGALSAITTSRIAAPPITRPRRITFLLSPAFAAGVFVADAGTTRM
jgi:hypothetical protein